MEGRVRPEFILVSLAYSLMANPLNYNTDNDGDQIYDINVKDSNVAVIKDSAISVCSLNMRSLTVSSDSVNWARCNGFN